MDIFFDVLLICHLLAFGVGVTSAIVVPILMSRMPAAPVEARPLFGGIGMQLGLNARIALGVLVVTGVLMIWVRYGGVEGLGTWFWVKMSLVLVVVAAAIIGAVARGRVDAGVMGWISRLALVGVVIAAVLAFN